MNCLIATRSMYPRLTAMAHSLLMDTSYNFKSIFNTNMSQSGQYLEQIIYNTDVDYIINIDEDAFVFDIDSMLDLLKYMDINGYGFCGVPDGGVIHHREHNPVVPNPFFNIFNCKQLRSIKPNHIPFENDDKIKGLFDDDLLKFTPHHLFVPNVKFKFDNFQWQYYHLFFNWLRNGINPLYLGAICGSDGISTIVKNHNDVPFLEHTWFARHYYQPDDNGVVHFNRINDVYSKYSSKPHFDIGIVVPCHGIPEHIKQRFLLKVESLDLDLKYIISFVDEPCLTNGYFNHGQCRNLGIKRLLKTCDVIVCCDIDLMIPPGLIEFTHRKCLQTSGLVFSYTRFIDQQIYDSLNDDELLNTISASSGLGPWNALSSKQWLEVGGWNENLYGWGYEDQELHARLMNIHIPKLFTNSFPLIHINHERRKSNFIESQRRNIKAANSSSLNKNWLKD